MRICYSGKSRPSAYAIEGASDDRIRVVRSSEGDVNWGRSRANTRLNPDISKTTNKRVMRQLFAENNVPMPKLVRGHDYTDPTSGYTLPIVGRPDTHSKGRGFWLCRTETDVVRAMQGTRKKRGATHFMEYIEAPREYRVHIFKGKSIRLSEKKFGVQGETSHGNYVTIKPAHPVKHVRAAAKKAVAAVGLDFGAVDILADNDNCWVLEVNSAPGLGGTLPKVYADMFLKWERGEV